MTESNMYKVIVNVTLKDSILDPQGTTGLHALNALGFQDVKGMRVGKYFILMVNSANETYAKERAEEMCQKLLANPIIEKYSVDKVNFVGIGTNNLGGTP